MTAPLGGARSRHAQHRASRLALGLAFATVYLCWGATFLAVRLVVADIPPLLTNALRCAGGALILRAWVRWRGQATPVRAEHWRTAFVAGALYFVGCHAVVTWAEQRVTSGQAALLMTAVPIWLVILDSIRRWAWPSLTLLAGLVLGVTGVATLTLRASWSGSAWDAVAVLFAALSWAAGSLVARHSAQPSSGIEATAMLLAAGAVCVSLAGVAVGEVAEWHAVHFTPRAMTALGFLILGGTVAGFGAYSWLLRATTPAAASTYSFVNPVIALGIGWAVGDDAVTGDTIVAAALVVAAVFVIWTANRQSARPKAQPSRSVAPGVDPRSRSGLIR